MLLGIDNFYASRFVLQEKKTFYLILKNRSAYIAPEIDC